MNKTTFSFLLYMSLVHGSFVFAQEVVGATFLEDGGKVRFWQTNHLSGGTGGVCVVKFGFEGESLKEPINDLTLTIRLIGKDGKDLGTAPLKLPQPLGGARVSRYSEATFDGVHNWPGQDDGEMSPLC